MRGVRVIVVVANSVSTSEARLWWIYYCYYLRSSSSRSFSSSDISLNPWTFKFNSTDISNVGSNETSETAFNVIRDTLTYINFSNNGSIVNRSDSSLNFVRNLSVIIFDSILSQNTLSASTPNLSLSEVSFFVNNELTYYSLQLYRINNSALF